MSTNMRGSQPGTSPAVSAREDTGAPQSETARPSLAEIAEQFEGHHGNPSPARPETPSQAPVGGQLSLPQPTLPQPTLPQPTPPQSTPPQSTPPQSTLPQPPSAPSVPAGRPSDEQPPVRKVTRDTEGAWLGGVASGIAQHLGWPTLLVRVGFVALSLVYFLGVALYGVLWVLMPTAAPDLDAPGLEAASRQDLRRAATRNRTRDLGAVTGLALLGGGMVWVTQSLGMGVGGQYFWPLAFAVGGLALVWRQADDSATRVPKGTSRWLAPFVTLGGWAAVVRLVVGLLMLGAAFALIVVTRIPAAQLPMLGAMTALALVGLGLVIAPWAYRQSRRVQQARDEQVIANARADMAAHLHDSVLQTLALIQRQSSDPKAVASLARRQERELRSWLYGGTTDATHLKMALVTAAQEVEDERGIPIEVVCVGDTELTTDLQTVVQAAREAMMNAAKHSGADVIDVYAEIDEGRLELFVRDRGQGFSLDDIGDDRHGVKSSIIARMERHGGRATIRSAPGEGTEIRLEMQT